VQNINFQSVNFPLTKNGVVRFLEKNTGRYVPSQTFYRWLSAAGLNPSFSYTARDAAKLLFLADFLRRDRSLARASEALGFALVEHPDWFPEVDGTYFSEQIIEVQAS
jgi:hypothetical protein